MSQGMTWEILKSLSVECDISQFKDVINVWIERPNVCSKVVSCASVEHISFTHLLNSEISQLIDDTMGERNILTTDNDQDSCIDKVMFRKLFPKNPANHSIGCEIVLMEKLKAVFIPVIDQFKPNLQEVLYKIELVPKNSNSLHEGATAFDLEQISIAVYSTGSFITENSKTCHPTEDWLQENLLPSLIKWTRNSVNSESKIPNSLSQLPQCEYAPLYQSLKEKYGKKIGEMWPESTDPQKYVYEDIAIATYLLLLWKNERKLESIDKPQSFVDLGCGNGLLVYILNSEGHPGIGVDIRRRKIWNLYPETTVLHETAIDPTTNVSYSKYDWLLGNHSDELTPWLPVLAAKSGFHVQYWVLPCCFFDFFSKYTRSESTSSQYQDYLDYVENVGRVCGFDVSIDVMRIPSTKRVCHIGMRKTYSEKDRGKVLQDIESLISNSRRPTSGFVARDKLQSIRNCTKLQYSLQLEVVKIISDELLKTKNYIKTVLPDETYCSNSESCNKRNLSVKEGPDIVINDAISALEQRLDELTVSSSESRVVNCKLWNSGGSITLCDAAGLLNDSMKQRMKCEYGGLQTLLKNHHQTFEIANGRVKLRNWSLPHCRKKKLNRNKKSALKTRTCWFYTNHPDGCPRPDEDCTFLHALQIAS